MLKKLVKYGNSNALVLDKALLEVLNIAEGSTVKIKTDGTSLIITPVDQVSSSKISPTITPHETFGQAINNSMDSFTKTKAPGEGQACYNEMRAVFARYNQPIKNLLNNAEFKKELNDLEQEFNGQQNPKYYQTLAQLHKTYNPELIAMENEIKEISQKYAAEQHQYQDVDNKGALTLAIDAFKKVHDKYAHIMPQVLQLNENEQYVHESVLLAEKYHNTKNSPECLNEYVQLIAKYVPEYGLYQDEIRKISQDCK